MGRARALGWLRVWTTGWVGAASASPRQACGFNQTKRDSATPRYMTGPPGGEARTGSNPALCLCSALTVCLEKEKKNLHC